MKKKIIKTVGILGGTFDPPHHGHSRISNLALNNCKLDQVWWVVSLSNPLKLSKKKTCFKKRFENAKKFNKDPRILVSDIESKIDSPFSVDMINHLILKNPKKKFIFLVGVDNLKNMHKWKDWKKIFYIIPIVIFDRPFYSLSVITSKCIGFFKKKRKNKLFAKKIKNFKPPCWLFFYGWSNIISSTKIRTKKQF